MLNLPSNPPFIFSILWTITTQPSLLLPYPSQDTVADLRLAVKKASRIHPVRQRLTLPTDNAKAKPVVLADDQVVAVTALGHARTLQVKDLGPQVSYQGVFLAEYLAPLILYALVYRFRATLYPLMGVGPVRGPPTSAQTLALGYWSAHYVKRLLETLFVHRFSHATMPLGNLFKNCSYYGLAGFAVSYYVNHPRFGEPTLFPHQTTWCLCLAALCQALNFMTHLQLASLRSSPNDKVKRHVVCMRW